MPAQTGDHAPTPAALLRQAAQAATRAPSLHNTQPWRFVVHPDRLDVLLDPERRLPVADPVGRSLHVSVGAAVECAALALAAAGRPATVRLLPDPASPLVAASLVPGEPAAPDRETTELAAALPGRATDRSSPHRRPVLASHAHRLVAEAAASDARLVEVWEPELRAEVELLQARADAVQSADPAHEAELRAWLAADGRRDGVPRTAVPRAGDPAAHRFTQRDFDLDGRAALPAVTLRDGAPLLLVLTTTGDGPRAWLTAGRALARVLLRAATLRLALVPMTQLVEVPQERERLHRRLGATAHPQVLLRGGYARRTAPPTPRRPLEEVLTVVVPAPDTLPV